MSDDNRANAPVDDGVLSFETLDDAAESLTDIVGPEDDLDPGEGDESNEAEADEDEDGNEPDASEDDEAGDDESSDDEEDDEDADAGPDDGFANEDALVQMADGRKITVKELRDFSDQRVKEIQSQTTRKNQELSERSKQVDEAAQTIARERDFLLQVFEQMAPQPPSPDLMDTDPIGYMRAKDVYDRQSAQWQHLRQFQTQAQQRQQQETQARQAELLNEERNKLMETMPHLRDPARFNEFKTDALKYGTDHYGFSPEEVSAVADSRYLRVLNDAIAFRKLKEQAPKTKQKVEGKPKMLKGSNRSSPKSKTSRSQRTRVDRLAQTGSIDDAAAVLMDFD